MQRARSITAPVLLVRGRETDMVSLEGVRRLQEGIPHAQVSDVADAGHMVAGHQNDAFCDALLAFLLGLRREGRLAPPATPPPAGIPAGGRAGAARSRL